MAFPKTNITHKIDKQRHGMAKKRREKAEKDLQVAKDELLARRLEEDELLEEMENEQGQCSCDDDEAQQETVAAASRPRPFVAVVKAIGDDAAARRKNAKEMGRSLLECDLTDFLAR